MRRVEAGEREKWKRVGGDGKLPAFSLFPSSTLRFLFLNHYHFFNGYPVRASAEKRVTVFLFVIFLLAEIDKKYCLPIDLVVFSFF